MTDTEFDKKRFTALETILFSLKCGEVSDEEMSCCLLIGIDFEQRLFKLRMIASEYYEEEQEFWERCEYCKRPAPRLKAVQ